MIIKGLQKTTLLDYPDRIACTIFLGGCNLRCPYCHNATLVYGNSEDISEETLFTFLRSRVGRLEGVCISGGEPTLHSDLPQLIAGIKELGFLVKLDTNGTNPEMLAELIGGGLVDYVAMDIKNSPEKYSVTTGVDCSALLDRIKSSARLLMEGGVEYEFRTTVTVEHHTLSDMAMIGEWLAGAKRYYLQSYREEGEQIVGGFTTPDRQMMSRLLTEIKGFIPSAEIRA